MHCSMKLLCHLLDVGDSSLSATQQAQASLWPYIFATEQLLMDQGYLDMTASDLWFALAGM